MPRSPKGGYESTAASPRVVKPPKSSGPGAKPAKKAPAKKVGLTDKKLAELGAAHEALRLRIKEMEVEQEGYKKTILAELIRRKTKAIDNGGVKITKVEQPMTTYSYDDLEDIVGEKKAKRYRPRTVDVAALSQDVQAGKIEASVIEAIATVGTKAPYISVTIAKAKA